MDEESFLVAVASSDGIVVNSHFGRASTFFIYEVTGSEDIRLVEQRVVSPVCEGGNHSEERLKENLLEFRDCKYLLVSRIGAGAARMAESLGMEAYEIPGVIEESITQLVKYIQVQRLFTISTCGINVI
ncbi:MAG: dinitrogenase iron-molybdenum cofactor biosynthesis protein [Lachnospiraceae bacterium]|nr:dinitrogenase iron-molybdenum cofactor biosynthesis protein [Lachnospiraceae bacterium]